MSNSLSSELEGLELLAKGQLPAEAVSQLADRLADDRHMADVVATLSRQNGPLLDALRRRPKGHDPAADRLVDNLLRRLGDGGSLDGTFDNTEAVPHPSPSQSAPALLHLDTFKIEKILGQGGMGTVYLAQDTRLGRQVAIKTLKRELAERPGAIDRFLREARTAAQVEHDHICPIYQVGEDNGTPYIAMPLLKGEPLDARLKRERPLPIPEAIRIGREIALGLAAAQDVGLIHRDIKPANVWMETVKGRAPRARILDFGLARAQADEGELTASGVILGTPAYMAPEQARGLKVDARADLWSLGVMLYEMTVGHRPFTGGDTMAILTSLAMDTPTPAHEANPAVPVELSALIGRLLSKQVDGRPADGQAVADELQRIQTHATLPGIEALPAGPSPVARHAATVVDPWGGIDDGDAVPVAAPVKPTLAAKPTRTASRFPWPLALALGFVLLIGGGFGVYKVAFETKDGTLVVEVDGDADVRFKNGKLELYDAAGTLKYTLEPSEKNRAIHAGKYQVKVVGGDGVKLETEEFTLEKGGKALVRVRADRPAATKKDAAKPVVDPDRMAAEYVLSVGGLIVHDGGDWIKTAADLPKRPFRLIVCNLHGIQKLTPEGLAAFKGCKNLSTLYLDGSRVTDAGLANFMGCTELAKLDLAVTLVTDAGLAHFKECKKLTVLGLNTTTVGDAGLANFKGCDNLATLFLDGTAVTDAGLATFKNCKDLLELSLIGTQVTDAGITALKDCKKLKLVYLSATPVTDAGLAVFKDCNELRDLSLKNTGVGDASMPVLQGFPGLATLNVKDTKLTPAGVKQLAAKLPGCQITHDGGVIEPAAAADPDRKGAEWVLSVGGVVLVDGAARDIVNAAALPKVAFRLTGVGIDGVLRVTDAGLANLKACKNLTFLALPGTGVTDAGLADFSGGPDFEILNLGSTAVGDAGVAGFKDCKRLKGLNLGKTKVTDAGLAHFKGCPDLTVLVVGNSPAVTDAGLAHFKGCTKLVTLALDATKITDAGLANFKDCEALTDLTMMQTDTGAAGLAHFKRCAKLARLGVGANVGDADVPAIQAFGGLTHLLVQGSKITPAGLKQLAAKLPACRIVHDGGVIEPTAAADPDRKAAEYVLSLGGLIAIDGGGEFKTAADLPKTPLQLRICNLNSNQKLTPEGLANFAGCKNLSVLYLAETRVTDADLAHFKACKTLNDLALNDTDIGDASVPVLQEFTGLTILNVKKTKLTGDGVKQLAAKLPTCRIEHDGGVIAPKK